MFQTAPGIHVPHSEQLEEKFKVSDKSLTFNISFDSLDDLVRAFIDRIDEPCFLILHIPATKDEEEALPEKPDKTLHDCVYYLDGLSKVKLLTILDQYGALFLQDGISQFGVASHQTGDELFIQKYKVVSIWSKDILKFIPFLQAFGVTQTDELITPWQLFSNLSPGECKLMEIDGLSIYDVVKSLEPHGLYFAKMVSSP